MHLGQVVDMQSPTYFAMIATLAFAMGIQTATLTHFGTLNVYTTFVTGTLTKFAESLSESLFWIHDTHASGTPMSRTVRQLFSQPDFRRSAFLLSVCGAADDRCRSRHMGEATLGS